MKSFVTIVLIFFTVPTYLRAEELLKHLYLANDTHTDLMWNGDEEDWYRWNLDMARFYLRLGEETRNLPPEARSKWNYDVAWTLYMMEKRESPEFFGRIIEQIRNGQASVPYNFTLAVYGASTLESALRSLYYGGYLQRKYRIPVKIAVSQENATLPLGLASLWAGSGAEFSWRGVCNCATRINTVGPRDHEIYWYAGPDGSRVLLKWYSNDGWNAELGGYAEMLEPTVAVQQMAALCGSERYPYLIAGAFGKGWDNIHNYCYDLQWGLGHRSLPGTKLHLSNQTDFFTHFLQEYGETLPQVCVSHGNEWDLNLASLAEVNGRLKRSMEKLRTAEALAALVARDYPAPFAALSAKKEAFLYGLGVFNLHGWTADGPIDRRRFAQYMRTQQQNVSDYVEALLETAAAELGRQIDARAGSVCFVFNPLSWERGGYVDLPAETFNGARDLTSGKLLPGTLVRKEGVDKLRVWVEKVPAVGYKLLQPAECRPSDRSTFRFRNGRLETPFYRVELTRAGVITSLFETSRQKEWVKTRLNDLGVADLDRGRDIVVVVQDERSITLRCGSDDPVRHQTELTFYADDPRIDIDNTIQENFDNLLHYSFDFAVPAPEVWHEEVGAVIKAKRARNGGHYADRMARTDYLTLNHFVTVGNRQENITLSNLDALFFRLGESTPDFLDEDAARIAVLVGGQVNENLGIIRQDGDSLFHHHFALRPQPGPFDAAASMRFALEHQNPLYAHAATGGRWRQASRSFMQIDKDVLLWTLKPGEEDGVVARVWNLSAAPQNVSLRFDPKFDQAFLVTHVETEIEEIPLSKNRLRLALKHQQLRSFKLK